MANIQTVQSLSERKHSNEKHYKFITQIDSMDSSIIDYLYDELKFAKNVPLAVFNKNRAISSNPNIFLASKEEEKDNLDGNWLRFLNDKLKNGDIGEKAIAYISLKELGEKPILTIGIEEELERVKKRYATN